MKIILFTLALIGIHFGFHAAAQHRPNEVLVLDETDSVPAGAKFIDKIKVHGGGLKEAGYMETIHKAKEKVLAKDGNVVKITNLVFPDSWNGSFRLHGNVYHLDNIDALLDQKARQKDSLLNSLIPDTASYALLLVYRPRGGSGVLVQYNLHADDSEICRVKNGERYEIKLKPGETRIWARTEARKEVYMDIKPGKAYYLKCSVKMGVFVGQPDFNIVDPYQGFMEYFYGNYNNDAGEQ